MIKIYFYFEANAFLSLNIRLSGLLLLHQVSVSPSNLNRFGVFLFMVE